MRSAATTTLRIAPSQGWSALPLGELWEYRELLYFLTWRDVKLRYKQTALGALWAILQPVLTMVVFSVFFGRMAKMPADGVPYPLFAIAALVPWTFFANGLAQSSSSLVMNAHLVKKVYFPRLAVPIASVMSGLVDFAVAFLVLLAMMAYFGYVPTLRVVFVPLFVLLALTTALGVGLWLAALNVKFRDIKYVVPFATQIWLFVTPIAYPSSLLPARWRLVYSVNPMAGVVEGFRWALLGAKTSPGAEVAVSSFAALLVLISGAFFFRRAERTFADVI